jgi:serine/threonine protein kinase
MSTWVGKTLGKVHIESLLARGGMAEVYLGTHTTLQREVAVKILRNNYDENPDSLARFQREARVVAKLRHPNIVQVFDFDSVDNHPYLIMEYIRGPSLSRYLYALHNKKKRLGHPVVVRLLNALASALQYAHASGVIHRDIKPGNILLTSRSSQIVIDNPLPDDFEPVLTDFGLVRFLDSSRHTTAGQIAGTPAYMSPEQARGELTDERTDVYSLGIVIYEILAGHLPFDGETTMSILLKHINDPPPPIPDLPPLLQMVLHRALAKDANERFQTPTEFAKAFSDAVEGKLDPSTLRLPAPVAAAPKTAPRKILRWGTVALALVTVIALGAVSFLRGSSLPVETETSTPPPSMTHTVTGPVATLSLGPAAFLRFQDGLAVADQVALIAQAMPAPPPGAQFEVWLMDSNANNENGDGGRRSLGILRVDANGKGSLIVTDEQALNLIALYDKVEITLEPDPDPDPDLPGTVAYSFTLPAKGRVHIRHLLVSYPNAPSQIALIQGLRTNVKAVDETTRAMLKAYERGDKVAIRQFAESLMNLLAGDQNPDYKDWNGNGQISNAGDGYGLLLNGNNLGYLQAVYSEADYAANTPDATQKMIVHGEDVKTCIQNLAAWVPPLRDRLSTIIISESGFDLGQPIRDSVALASQMLNGVDNNGNGMIESIPGECGANSAYEFAYYMADMPLLPVGSLFITGTPPTPSNTFSNLTRTPTPGETGGSTNPTRAPPGQAKTPPGQDKPDNPNKPPKDNNNKP